MGTTGNKAFIYCRISNDKTGEALGVQRQEEDCRRLAREHGFDVVEVFIDNDVSAYSGKRRPAYEAMLDALKQGRANRVYCWAEDRLHRRPVELEEYIALVSPAQIQTYMVQGGDYDLVTPEGQFRAGVMGQVARFESARKAERVRRAQEQKIRAGGWTGGTRPFGWQFSDGVPVHEEAEAALVREAFHHVLSDRSLGSLVTKWNEAGIPTSVGKMWGYSQLKQMLFRSRNAGLAEWKGEIVGPSEFPAIVSEDVWRATVSKLSDPSRRRSQSNKARHLLSGIARCHCGELVRSATVTGRNGQRHRAYRCPAKGPGHVGKRMEYVDELVTTLVIRWMSTAWANTPPPNVSQESRELELEAVALRQRLDDVAVEAADGILTMSQLRTMTERITAKLSAVEAQMVALHTAHTAATASALQPLAESDAAAAEIWAKATLDERRALLRRSFDITLLPHGKGSTKVFNPNTVSVYPKGYGGNLSQEELAAVRKSFEAETVRE